MRKLLVWRPRAAVILLARHTDAKEKRLVEHERIRNTLENSKGFHRSLYASQKELEPCFCLDASIMLLFWGGRERVLEKLSYARRSSFLVSE